MSEISQNIPEPPTEYDPAWFNRELSRMQQEIYKLRQFLEPAIKLNANCPEQEFNPLE